MRERLPSRAHVSKSKSFNGRSSGGGEEGFFIRLRDRLLVQLSVRRLGGVLEVTGTGRLPGYFVKISRLEVVENRL